MRLPLMAMALSFLLFFINCSIAVANDMKFRLPQSGDQLILSYQETHGNLDANDNKSMRVFGDGTVLVHYPIFMKKAGDYRMKLSSQELNEFLGAMVSKNIHVLNSDDVLSAKQEESIESKPSLETTLFTIHDASIITIEMINIETYIQKPSTTGGLVNSAQEVTMINNKITWAGLRADTKKYPHNIAIQNLSDVHQILLKLQNNPRLERSK